jgi:hypothetical protein
MTKENLSTQPAASKRSTVWPALAAMAGLSAPLLASILAAFGRGWVAPQLPSWGLVVVGPLVAVAWSWRDRRWGFLLACLLAVLLIAGDGFILAQTQESMDGFRKAWQHAAPFVIVWFVVWAYPHVLVLLALCARLRRPGTGPPTVCE